MTLKVENLVRRLSGLAEVLPVLVADITPNEAAWKPASGNWSILEICCHLLDEEREDFRARIDCTLRDPAQAWPPLELDRVAELRGYNTRDLHAVVSEFVRERRESLRWLRGLHGADWSRAHVYPKVGPISAGDLLSAWAAHDALHIRQIAKRLYELAGEDGSAMGQRYAGEWGP